MDLGVSMAITFSETDISSFPNFEEQKQNMNNLLGARQGIIIFMQLNVGVISGPDGNIKSAEQCTFDKHCIILYQRR